MDDVKAIYVRRGEVLRVECLEDAVTKEGYFLIRNEQGTTVKADRIYGDGVVFTANGAERTDIKNTLHYQIYLTVKELVENDLVGIDMEQGQLDKFGVVNYTLAKNLTVYINSHLGNGEFRRLTTSTVSNICRQLGFRFCRTGRGYVFVLEKEDLLAIGMRFENTPQAE